MSVAISTSMADMDTADVPVLKTYAGPKPLHRLAAVRQQEGISRRTVARRLGITPSQVQQQEQESSDMSLSALYAWQEALEVPITELLVESDVPLSAPVMRRAQMLRMMKTVQTILERSRQLGVRRLAQLLAEQLLEAMPELQEVGGWPAVGQRRRSDELGQAAHRHLAYDAMIDHSGELR